MKPLGVIYILTNPSFPDYVKIGYADDLEKRLKELNRSECTPFAFRAYAYYEVDHRLTDMKLHSIIDKLNPDLRSIDTVDGKKRVREFYAMSPEDAYDLLAAIAEINGLSSRLHLVKKTKREDEEEREADEIRTESAHKMRRFSFTELGIPPKTILYFIKDPKITVEVVDEKRVSYKGAVTSLSAVTNELLSPGGTARYNGAMYFTFKGEKISDLWMAHEKKPGA